MTKRTAVCRVCGKQFVPCNKSSASLGAFNYHSIACSSECGAEYLRRVQEARKQPEQNKTVESNESTNLSVAGEISEKEVEKSAEPVISTIYRFRKNKQETNEE